MEDCLTATLSSLKDIAKEFDVAVVANLQADRVIFHYNRMTDEPRLPTLDGINYAWEYDFEKYADIIGVIYRPSFYAEESAAPWHLIVARNRFGRTITTDLSALYPYK